MKYKTVELEITDLAYNGKAVAHLDGKVTFINGGLPGESVVAKIVKAKKSYNEARLIKLLSKSPERIEAPCEHYDICGGCTWQDLAYDHQLQYKQNQIAATLKHIGGLEDIPIEPIVPAPDKFFYRNKMEFSFHTCSETYSARGFVLGLHLRGRFDRIFDVNQCHLQSPLSNELVKFVRDKTEELGIPAYDLVKHHGFLRFLIVREGKNTGQTMVALVTGEGDFPRKDEFTESLLTEFPQLTTIVWLVNPELTNIARGEVREILHGPGYIEEVILGNKFRISPLAFFQTNSRQTENLYRAAIEMAEIDSGDILLDLYCGAGTIGICAAAKAGEVIGIEIEEESVAAARLNASLNGASNCRFYAGPVRKVLLTEELREQVFDPVIIDPPRAGMHPKAFKRVREIAPSRLAYVSCNPATFARDAAELTANGYKLVQIRPFDMFPHTMHIELVAKFKKNS